MRKFYLIIQKGTTLSTLLSWYHYVELLTLDNTYEINYYIDITNKDKISVRELRQKIKNQEYERIDDKTKEKLIKKEKPAITDFVKNPIIIKNNLNYKEISEKYLKKLILEDISSFMKELGPGFSFIDSEYKIKIGDTYNYIDLLLFNIKYNSYVVIELKVTELKKEYIGQLEIYMNYINKNIKQIQHNGTIGIIICKHDNKLVLEYCSDPRIFTTTFELI